ncbi:hypothetical protein ACS0TY_003964 [Phlomoides rotata]
MDGEGRKRGLCLMWREGFTIDIQPYSLNHIDAWVGKMLEVLGAGFWGPWMVLGDFNLVMYGFEKKGDRRHDEARSRSFRDCLDGCGLQDLGFEGNRFTWTNKQAGVRNIQQRLDRVRHLTCLLSDHCPLCICWEGLSRSKRRKKVRPFRFETFWLRENGCSDIVSGCWDQGEGVAHLADNLKRCESVLYVWDETEFGYLPKEIEKRENIWDTEMLQRLFTPTDMVNVLNVTLLGYGGNDALAWRKTKNGIYTTKSGYLELQEERLHNSLTEDWLWEKWKQPSTFSGNAHGRWPFESPVPRNSVWLAPANSGALITVLWSLWYVRNNLVFQQRVIYMEEVLQVACNQIMDHTTMEVGDGRMRFRKVESRWWEAPAGLGLKLNTVASVRAGFGAAIGGVIRDSSGGIVWCFAERCE